MSHIENIDVTVSYLHILNKISIHESADGT